MGLFNRDPEAAAKRQAAAQERAAATKAKQDAAFDRLVERARAACAKHGIDTTGTITVGQSAADGYQKYLLVFPDRIDLVNRGKVGTLTRPGAGTETIPVARVSSTQCRNTGMWSTLEIHTSGNSIEYKTDQVAGPYLRNIIQGMVDNGSPAAAPEAQPNVMDQLRQLGELHAAGVLTDDEFAAKKADLLDRL